MRPTIDKQPKYLTIPEAAAHVSVCPNTIRYWVREGWLRAVTVRAVVRISVSELELFLHRNSRLVMRNAPKGTRGKYHRQNSNEAI